MVGVLPRTFCPSIKHWKASYEPYKRYLGGHRTLPQDVYVELAWEFRGSMEEAVFFDFWVNETNHGEKAFYVYTALYGERKHYLVSLDGNLSHTKRPLGVSGKFTLYQVRTLEDNNPPILLSQSFSVDMDSTSNFIYVAAEDYDVLRYEIVTPPSHGVVGTIDNGVVYYTPTDGFYGVDTFVVRVTDELGAVAEATMHVTVINWKLNEAFKLTMDAKGHLHIDYVNPATLDPLVIQAVDELSLGGIDNNGAYVITLPTTHIDSLEKTADDEWLITPK